MDKKTYMARFVRKDDSKLGKKSFIASIAGWGALLVAGLVFSAADLFDFKRLDGDEFDVHATDDQIRKLYEKGGIELWDDDEIQINPKEEP